ncbi:MAG: LysE family transporter [Cardiobacterium hominis]
MAALACVARRRGDGTGAVAASALWFFGLGFGARLLLPLFRQPLTWRLLDAAIGVVMWLIAWGLLRYGLALW